MVQISPGCDAVEETIEQALAARLRWDPSLETRGEHTAAFRLLNGFLEGCPLLAVELYADTLVIFAHGQEQLAGPLARRVVDYLKKRLPWIQAAIVKNRQSEVEQERRGTIVFGQAASRKVSEQDVWYAVDLTMNMDASLYLDTRLLRNWLKANMSGKRVLNTFAYTGSLGVASIAGGASKVVHIDRSRQFLNLAKESYSLNGFPVRRADFIAGDFWTQVGRLKREEALFDCVLVDPPFFSQTEHGRVDLVAQAQRVINKVRPLVAHNGWLVTINNALFLSGQEYIHQLEDLCASGYLSIEELIDVPPDCAGFPGTRVSALPADPSPFNHSTKIAVLRARRKDGRTAY